MDELGKKLVSNNGLQDRAFAGALAPNNDDAWQFQTIALINAEKDGADFNQPPRQLHEIAAVACPFTSGPSLF